MSKLKHFLEESYKSLVSLNHTNIWNTYFKSLKYLLEIMEGLSKHSHSPGKRILRSRFDSLFNSIRILPFGET